MPKGESSREKVRWQIQEFLLKGPATFTKIVEVCDAARATVSKYLDDLIEEENVIWKPQRKRGKSTYELSNKMKSEIEKKLLKDDLYDLTDSFNVKWLRILRNLLNNMKKKGTDPYTFFQSNCLTFVGGIPRTFHKSMDGMKNALSFEKNLYVQAIKKGLSKEKFYADVLKRISKLDGIERLLEYQRLMGVSDD
ncbi:hypothetical protein ACFLRN_08035 [Thermoproteota archaeon]